MITWKQSSTEVGAITTRGASPWPPKSAWLRSDCSVLVGMPVDGPERCASTITAGISAMPARPTSSAISERPGPDVAVIALRPANEAPSTEASAAISSSVWIATPPKRGSRAASHSRMSDAGVIG